MAKYHIKAQATAFSSSLPTHKIIRTKNDLRMSLLMLYCTSLSLVNQIGLIDSICQCTVIKPIHNSCKKCFSQFEFSSCYQNTILSSSPKEKKIHIFNGTVYITEQRIILSTKKEIGELL